MDLDNTATLYIAATKYWPEGDHNTEVPLYYTSLLYIELKYIYSHLSNTIIKYLVLQVRKTGAERLGTWLALLYLTRQINDKNAPPLAARKTVDWRMWGIVCRTM